LTRSTAGPTDGLPGSMPVEPRARWAILAGLTLVTFLLLLDDTAVSVALPTIQRQLGVSLNGVEWVIKAYSLTLAVFTLLAGRLADRDGRRRLFLVGLGIFVLGSLASGLAPSGGVLILTRAVQGLGAALVAPTSLAIIAETFPKKERGMALGVWAGVSSSALGFGPLFGAIINDSLGWSWIFLVNVPLGAGAWLVARAVLRESRVPDAPQSLDLVGAGLSAGGLLALLLALSQAGGAGWSSPGIISLFAVAAIGFALFVRHERRTKAPLLDLALFKERSFAGANVLILMATAVMCSLFFFLALYMQTVLGYSALGSGATLLPLTVTIVVVAPLAGRLADRIGARIPATIGMLLLAAGLLGLSTLGVKSGLGSLIPWLTLTGLGIGLVTTPTTTAALGATGSEGYGTVAGVFNTFRATGLSLGIAIMVRFWRPSAPTPHSIVSCPWRI
jgi:EmrB/QacA subfamily drug resistance transporter